MNSKGDILARPLDRTLESFERTRLAIDDYSQLKKRAASGEENLEFDFFILERTLGILRGNKLRLRAKALKGLDAKQQLVVTRILLEIEVQDLVLASLGGPEAVAQAGLRMRQILESGQYPDLEKSANAWSVLSRYGESISDAGLLERCAKGLRSNFADDVQMVNWAKSLQKKAQAIRVKQP